MSRIVWLTLLALASAVAAAQDTPDHPDKLRYKPLAFEPPDPAAMRSVLANGIVLYAIEDRSRPLVELQVLARTGAFWEPKGKEGLAAMCGSLMRTGGTARHQPDLLDEEIDFIAAEIGVSIGETSGSASLSVVSKDLDEGLALLFEILREPAFRQDKIDLAKAQLLQSMRARNDNTASIESREANLLLYGDYPVNALPTQASIESITREDLIAFHRTAFAPGGLVIAAAGDFDRKSLEASLLRLTDGWSAEAAKREVPAVSHRAKGGVYTFHKDGENINQGRVTMAHLGIDVHHPKVHTLRLLSYILGSGGFTSRLMQRVRTEEGLAYDVRSGYAPGIVYPGTFRIQFQSKSESCLYAAKLCLEELRKMQAQPVGEQELKEAIQFFLDGFPGFFFSTRYQTVSTYATAELNGLPRDYYRTYREKIAAVTPQDILAAAKEFCRPEDFIIVVVGNVAAIKAGDGKHDVRLEQFGAVQDLPLPDPMSLERPKRE